MNRIIPVIAVSCSLAVTTVSRAEEGGTAHYLPGSVASFIDVFPAKPGGLAVKNYFTYYDGDVPITLRLPRGGLAFGLAVPYVSVDVKAQAQRVGPGGVPGPVFAANQSEAGIGDMTIYPFMLG